MLFLLTYVQPRPARFDSRLPIFERKQYLFEGNDMDEDAVEQAVKSFIRGGRVLCGGATYVRTRVSLIPVPPPSLPLQPKQDFLSMDERVRP